MSNEFGATEGGFNKKTYLDILEDMGSKARELFGENLNLNENSPFGLFIQSIAWELSSAWDDLENSYYNTSALNATGASLDEVISNYGKERFNGTKAVGEIKAIGEKDTVIPVGFIVGTIDELLFTTIEEGIISDNGDVLIGVESEEIGVIYNIPGDTITEIINPIAGLVKINNIEETKGGSDIETDANFRERQLEALRKPTTGDNVAQYEQWAKEIPRVGSLKVLATTPTKGYVTIVLADSNGSIPTEALTDEVYNHIEVLKPVNAGIYVEGAKGKDITIKASIQNAPGYRVQDIQSEFNRNIEDYFKSIALKDSYVSYAQIGKLLLETKGLLDYDNLLLNDLMGNIELSNTEIPVAESVELEVK